MQQPDRALLSDAPGTTLYESFAPALFAYLLKQTASREDAEDLLLEVFLAALERGNKCLITLNTGKPEPKWIEANPAEKTIRIYGPEPLSKKRASDGRRPAVKRDSRKMSDPSVEKTAEDQELSEETTAVSGK